MTREPDPTGFDAIVAAWRAEGNVPQWPDDPQLDELAVDARTGVDTDAPTDRTTTDRAPTDRTAADHAPADHPAGDRPDGPASGQFDPDAPGGLFDPDGLRAEPGRPDETPGGLFDADAEAPSRHRPDPDADHPDDPGREGGATGREADPAADGDPHAENATGRRGGSGERDHRGGAAGREGDPHAADAAGGGGPANSAAGGERGQQARAGAAAEQEADEHFVPPEPPPLPRMGPPILVGLTLIGLGLVLVTFPGWVGVPQVYGLPLGLVAIAAGLGWLVLRLWPDPDDVPPPLYLDDPDDPDGGAVL